MLEDRRWDPLCHLTALCHLRRAHIPDRLYAREKNRSEADVVTTAGKNLNGDNKFLLFVAGADDQQTGARSQRSGWILKYINLAVNVCALFRGSDGTDAATILP